jgi:serine/threonine-protein phosphatase 2A regulatory subunit B
METDSSSGWRFAQCFGDKGDVEDITEGNQNPLCVWSRCWACVGTFTPAPWTLMWLPLYLSRNHTHIIQFCAADIISAVEFDSTGNYLATGDKGGRVVLFERNDQVRPAPPCSRFTDGC